MSPRYYKVLRKEANHHGFQYKVGLNVLKGKFNPKAEFGPGGLNFCKEKDILRWIDTWWDMEWFAEVTLCPDSQVIELENVLRTDKFILGSFMSLAEYINRNPEAALRRNYYSIKYIENQTPEMCMTVVKKYGALLEYVKEQTPEICLAAVQQVGLALEYVKEQTPEICLAAIKQHAGAIRYVK